MVEQQLEPARFHEVEVHIDSCENCRKMLAAAVAERTLAFGTPVNPTALGSAPTASAADDIDPFAAIVDVSINGRYVIDAVLGRGGMGTVYLARDLSLGREVALKLHRAGSGNDRLHREAIAMAKLAHPNVVTVFEVATVDDRLYVAMEYVRGETLRGWLATAPRTWRHKLDMLLQAGQGLAAAHAAGLVHRDFKPENVLVGEDGRPRVSDFGLARVGVSPGGAKPTAVVGPMTQTGALMGTPAYMSPEQLSGDSVDARSDQFAFCVVAWECLYGKRPFTGLTLAGLEDAMMRGELQRVTRTEVPQRVRDVLERGLAISPADRYADMPALLGAVRAAAIPRTRRYLALGLAGVTLAAGATFAISSLVGAHRHAAECVAAGDDMRAVFDGGTREQMRIAFIASGSPTAVTAFERTAAVLTRYGDNLAKQASALCLGHDEPLRLTSARRACLADRKSRFAGLVDELLHAEAPAVREAPSAAWSAFEPAPCDDAAMLLAQPVVPTLTTREQSKAFSRVRALESTGRYEAALAAATPLLEQARADKNRHFELDVLMAIGAIRAELEPAEAVAPVLQDAVQLAETLGRDLDAAVELSQLAHLVGVVQHRFEPAHRYVALARAKLERLGAQNVAARGHLLGIEGQVLSDENRLVEAEQAMRQAITALEHAYGPDHPNVGSALGSLSQILRAEYKPTEAIEVARRAGELLAKALGADHPTVGGSEMTLGQLLVDVKQFDDARARFEHAETLFARAFGPDHPVHAQIWANLGDLELKQEHWDAALTQFRRAIARLERVYGADSVDVAGARTDAARALAELGRVPEAIIEQQRAIATLDKLGADGEPRVVVALTELAEYQLFVKQAALALASAQRALEIAIKRTPAANGEDLAEARFLVARAMWETGGDKRGALALAREAEAHAGGAMHDTIVAWLAER